MAKNFAIVTRCTGRSNGVAAAPISNEPDGMMISSGQSGQSRRLSPERGAAVCEGNAAGGAMAGRATWIGGGAGASCEGEVWTAAPGGAGESGTIDDGGGVAGAGATGLGNAGPDCDVAAGGEDTRSCFANKNSSLNDETTHGI